MPRLLLARLRPLLPRLRGRRLTRHGRKLRGGAPQRIDADDLTALRLARLGRRPAARAAARLSRAPAPRSSMSRRAAAPCRAAACPGAASGCAPGAASEEGVADSAVGGVARDGACRRRVLDRWRRRRLGGRGRHGCRRCRRRCWTGGGVADSAVGGVTGVGGYRRRVLDRWRRRRLRRRHLELLRRWDDLRLRRGGLGHACACRRARRRIVKETAGFGLRAPRGVLSGRALAGDGSRPGARSSAAPCQANRSSAKTSSRMKATAASSRPARPRSRGVGPIARRDAEGRLSFRFAAGRFRGGRRGRRILSGLCTRCTRRRAVRIEPRRVGWPSDVIRSRGRICWTGNIRRW